MRGVLRAASLALLCLAACGKGDSARESAAAQAPAPAPIDGRIDPTPYRAQIEATEAILYSAPKGEEAWKELSKALLELHNAIVFRDTSALARQTSQKLFIFSAQVEAAPSGHDRDEQLKVMRGVWEDIRAKQFARADWFHTTSD